MDRLGLKHFVPLNELLDQICKTPISMKVKLIDYFALQYDLFYRQYYNASKCSIAFLFSEEEIQVIPNDVFSDISVATLGFKVIHPLIKHHVTVLGVRDSPDSNEIVSKFKETKVTSIHQATLLFEFLASKQTLFSKYHWSILTNLKFIPYISKSQTLIFESPSGVYFLDDENDNTYEHIFTYVDFGSIANSFLRSAGVKNSPSTGEIAQHLVKNPNDFLSKLGSKKYHSLLVQIASQFESIKGPDLISQMKKSQFLVATQEYDQTHDSINFELASATQIYLIDDTVLGQLFMPLGAPVDELLESFYFQLGSRWLSSCVKEEFSYKGSPMVTDLSKSLKDLIQSRSPLLLYDGLQKRNLKDLKLNGEKTIMELEIREVESIEICRTFEAQSKQERTTCCFTNIRNTKIAAILVTRDYDFFDIATMVCKILFKFPRLKDVLLISTLLSSSLDNLTRKGFPVSRILNLTKSKAIVNNMAIKKPLSNETRDSEIWDKDKGGKANDQNVSANPNEMNIIVEELKNWFPNADPFFLEQFFISMWPSTIEKIVDKLLEANIPSRSDNEKESMTLTNESPVKDSGTGKNIFKDMLQSLSTMSKSIPIPGMNISSNDNQGNSHEKIPTKDINPNQTKTLHTQLKKSIHQSRATSETNVKGKIGTLEPPQSSSNSCYIFPETDLELSNNIDGIPFYIDKRVLKEGNLAIQQNPNSLGNFAHILKHLAKVFDCPEKAIHIYWDHDGSTIAFNRNRSLFFNLRFYIGLHYNNNNMPGGFYSLASEKTDCIFYWFMTFCHELAHHFVSSHDANHEHYMSSFAESYLCNLVKSMIKENMSFE
jgi:hypothetical protein